MIVMIHDDHNDDGHDSQDDHNDVCSSWSSNRPDVVTVTPQESSKGCSQTAVSKRSHLL